MKMGCTVWALRFLVHCWSHHRPVVLGNTSMFKKSISYKKLVPNYIELLKLTYMSINVHHQRLYVFIISTMSTIKDVFIYVIIISTMHSHSYHVHLVVGSLAAPRERHESGCRQIQARKNVFIQLPNINGSLKGLVARFMIHIIIFDCGLSYMYGYIYI